MPELNTPPQQSEKAVHTVKSTLAAKPHDLLKKCSKAVFWIVLMFAMIGLFTILYDVNYTRPYLHEIFASIIIVVLGFHVGRNYHFFSSVCRKNFPCAKPNDPVISRYANKYFILCDVINVLLIVSCLICLITGILISKFVFKDIVAALFAIENTRAIRPYHAMSSYILLICIGLHAGLHLPTLFNFIEITLGKIWQRLILGGLVLIAINGLYNIFAYNFISKFALKASKSIGTLHPELYRIFYWTDLISIAIFFALISYTLIGFCNRSYQKSIE